MSSERTEGQVLQLIGQREAERNESTHFHRNYYEGEHLKRLPVVSLPQPVNILINSPSLWLKVENTEYTPSSLVKSFFVRKDGREINEKKISVFYADTKRNIATKWGIISRSTWNKQRHQYWDKDFVKALFTYITLCGKSHLRNVNKILYTVRDDITFEEMETLYLEANTEAADITNKR